MALPNTNPTYQYIGGTQADGVVYAQTSAQLQAFWGATPSAQVAFTNAAIATTVASSASGSFSFTSAQANGILLLLNEVRAAMVAMGLKA